MCCGSDDCPAQPPTRDAEAEVESGQDLLENPDPDPRLRPVEQGALRRMSRQGTVGAGYLALFASTVRAAGGRGRVFLQL